jgi:hypothetical protein
MARRSPFADLDDGADGPAPDALVVELGRPTRAALGCFGLTTAFLAAIGLAALSYAVFGVPGPGTAPGGPRVVTAVLGGIFLLIVVGLGVTMVKAMRSRQALALDAAGVWWRADSAPVLVPWSDIAAVQVVTPGKVRGARTSTPRTPAVELCPVDDDTIRRYPALTDQVIGGAPCLRFVFRLPMAAGKSVADTIARLAPDQWAAGTTAPSAE